MGSFIVIGHRSRVMMKLQQILVTGGAGFIGSHTVDLLLQLGYQVRVLDNFSSGKRSNLSQSHPALQVVAGDVLDEACVIDCVNSCDAILHLAAIVSVPQSIVDPLQSFRVNTQGFLHVLQAVKKCEERRAQQSRLCRPIRVVYASSAAVYGGETQLPCRDDLPLSSLPLSPYALQKMHKEDYAALFAKIYGIPSLGLRYFNVYGRRQDANSPYSGVITRFINAYQQDKPLLIFGDGQQSRDFIHVSDVAMANYLALQSDYQGSINIATGQPQTLLQLVRCLESVGQHPVQLQFADKRAGDIPHSYAATQLAKTHLQFEAQISLQQGMKQLLQESCVL